MVIMNKSGAELTNQVRRLSLWMSGKWIYPSLLIILFTQIIASRDQWFFGDEFSIFADRRQSMAPIQLLLTPHNEHWSTVPIIKDLILHKIFGFSTYLPYLLAVLLVHATVIFSIYLIGRRSNVSEKILVPIVSFFSIAYFGSENILWGFQFGFIAPLAMFLASGVLLLKGHRFAREISSVLMLLSVASSGTSIAFLVTMFLYLAVNGKIKDAVIVTFPAGFLFLFWRYYFSVSPDFPFEDSLYDRIVTYWSYLVTGGTSSLESLVKIPGSGATLFFLVSALIFTAGKWKGKHSFPTYVALSGYISFLIFAYSRAGLGIEQAKASRYSYLFILCLSPIVIIWIDKLMKRMNTGYVAYVISILVMAVVGVSQFLYNENAEANREYQLRGTLMISAQIAAEDERYVAGSMPDPIYAPEFTIENTLEMLKDGAFDSTKPSEKSELAARVHTQVTFVENPSAQDVNSLSNCTLLDDNKPESEDLEGNFRILSPNPINLVFKLRGRSEETLLREVAPSTNGYSVGLLTPNLVVSATGTDVTICR